MSKSVYIASSEGFTGKSTVALGLLDALAAAGRDVGVFRPVHRGETGRDDVADMLVAHDAVDQTYDDALGVPYRRMFEDPDAAENEIVARYQKLVDRYDTIVVVGSDYLEVTDPNELAFNARIAADIGAPVVLVVRGLQRTPAQIATLAEVALAELVQTHAEPIAVVASRVAPDQVEDVCAHLAGLRGDVQAAAIPEHGLLMAPTVEKLMEASAGRLIRGDAESLSRASLGYVIAAMSLPEVLIRLTEGCTVIAPGDRVELLPALLLAHQSTSYPGLASIFLTGGYAPPETMQRLVDGLDEKLPVVVTELSTFDTAQALGRTRGHLNKGAAERVETAKRLVAENMDVPGLLATVDAADPTTVTPLMYQFELLRRARGERKRIVLPEGEEPRIIAATEILLTRGIADLILLGDERTIRARADELGHDLSGARIQSLDDAELVEKYAAEYAQLRAHKGVTIEQAREKVKDVSYFGTMMVHMGDADGMVSGAVHTTAHTIKPSFEVIKTRPGTSVVSSVFLMLLEDRVLVYGDCAVNPDPTAEQLADIAISSAATAAEFGVDPRIAMLSYSTGSSGTGADVDKVRTATGLVHERQPGLSVEGPIQYDAAVDVSVAKTKLPDSQVAGRATVFVFPDLNTGNNTYKAVQRSAGAVAIGPVLQGLNKPVNDLSRGALVDDIVNTVVITAVQAQSAARDAAPSPSAPASSTSASSAPTTTAPTTTAPTSSQENA